MQNPSPKRILITEEALRNRDGHWFEYNRATKAALVELRSIDSGTDAGPCHNGTRRGERVGCDTALPIYGLGSDLQSATGVETLLRYLVAQCSVTNVI